MLKRIVSAIIAITMILAMFTFTAHARTYTRVANVSTMANIVSTGMTASNVYTKTGNFTLKWSGSDINKNIIIPTENSDFSACDYLEFYVYSAVNTNSNITIGLISDDSNTVCLDYYYTTIKMDFKGWKLFSLPYKGERSVFAKASSPLGLNSINQIRLWSGFGGATPDPLTELYIDSFFITNEKSDESIFTEEYDTYTLLDCSIAENITSVKFPASSEQTKTGDVSLKWSEETDRRTLLEFTGFDGDFTPYKTIAITLYNNVINNSSLRVYAYMGSDYYCYDITLDFVGWNTIMIPIRDMKKTDNALILNKVDKFRISPRNKKATPEDPEPSTLNKGTVFYIDRIYLTTEEETFDDTVDYIVPHIELDNQVDMVSKIVEKTSSDPHPRFLFNQTELNEIKERIITDPYAKFLYNDLIRRADAIIPQAVEEYSFGDMSIGGGDGMVRTSESRLPCLAMAYLLSGEEKYKDRLWAEVEAICAFPNWGAAAMLNVGTHGLPMAIAYDWMYDHWTEQQRRIVRNALSRHCIEPGLVELRTNGASYAQKTGNWNQVCNGAIGLSALAIGDEDGYKDFCNETINRVRNNLPVSLVTFAPDGGTHEGVGYWEFGLTWFYIFHNSLMTACGDDMGLGSFEGLDVTGYYPIALTGSTGLTFNYGDCAQEAIDTPIYHWLARFYNKPEFQDYVMNGGGAMSHYGLAMYRPTNENVEYRTVVPLDNKFISAGQVGSTRSSWGDENALFAGYIAGDNQEGHACMDVGSFILEALGTRWITDFGQDVYSVEGAGDVSGPRWKFYRKSAEGHNVVIFNPKDVADLDHYYPQNSSEAIRYPEGQNPMGKAEIDIFKSSASAHYGVIDMLDAYSRDVKSYKRALGLINNRSQFVVRDEIETLAPSEIYSFFHTQEKIHIINDKLAYMYTGESFENANKKLRIDLLTDAPGAKFVEMEAKFVVDGIQREEALDNSAWRKLSVYIEKASNPSISVVFTPVSSGQTEKQPDEVLPISQWDNYLVETEILSSLSVDGVPVENFSSYNLNYTINAAMVGEVSATAADGYTLSVSQADEIGKSAVVTATDNSGNSHKYTVLFDGVVPEVNLAPSEVAAIYPSDVPQDYNPAEHTIDGDLTTRWAANSKDSENGEQWFIWDMGKDIEFDTVYFSFFKGHERKQKLQIQVSNDNINYSTVFDGEASGKTDGLQPFAVGKQNARYIKFIGFGCNASTWNSVNEFVIPQKNEIFYDMQNHWAQNEVTDFSNAGLVKGVSETQFCPDNTVTRAEFAELLYRTLYLDDAAKSPAYADVKETDWFCNSVSVLKEKGYIPEEMTIDGKFYPDKPITREEITALVIRAYESNKIGIIKTYGLNRFVDKDLISPYASEYVEKAVSLHIIKGVNDTSFAPQDLATRAQAIVILKRLYSLINY